ncbi:MAG TPA: class I SAM-dependent methyltransferase [Burkholderiales bacterium]
MNDASSPFQPHYFAELARIESGNFWFRARNRLIVWALAKHFGAARSFLEIGCGTGFVLAGIAAARPELALAASDVYSEGLAFAARRVPRARFFQADARGIGFSGEFDVVGAFDVLEHITEDEQVLRAMHRALRPGGGVLITVPQHPALWSVQDVHAGHRRRYTKTELAAKLHAAGFTDIRATSFVCLLLPVMALARLRKRNGADPFEELRIAGIANLLLEKVLDVERGLIRLGVSFPFGGSLLVAARKALP